MLYGRCRKSQKRIVSRGSGKQKKDVLFPMIGNGSNIYAFIIQQPAQQFNKKMPGSGKFCTFHKDGITFLYIFPLPIC